MAGMIRKTGVLILLLTLAWSESSGAGSVGLGFNLGFTYDQLGLEPEISALNSRMMEFAANNSGTDMTPLNIPYSPVIGVNIRYSLNNLMVRTGIHYARSFLYPPAGNIAPSGAPDNMIKFDSYAATVPLNLLLRVQPFEGAALYFGPGAGATISRLMITQSSPNGFLTPDETSLTYQGNNIGWNWILGIELPVGENSFLTAEWILQSALTGETSSQETGHQRPLDASCSILLFGYNYNLRLD